MEFHLFVQIVFWHAADRPVLLYGPGVGYSSSRGDYKEVKISPMEISERNYNYKKYNYSDSHRTVVSNCCNVSVWNMNLGALQSFLKMWGGNHKTLFLL